MNRLSPDDIIGAINCDNRHLLTLGACRATAIHLCDRATKHEHQAKANKDFADGFCFHLTEFPFIVLAFPEVSLLRTHFWPFTEVVRKIRREGYAEHGSAKLKC
jgi:hypothetical protein